MIRQLHDSLWVMDFPLKMPGGVRLGTRTTLVRLSNGGLFVHSPGPADETDFSEIEKLGEVAHIVAPNLLHHFSVKAWMARCDGAALYAPPSFEQKLPGLRFETLTDEAPAAWAGEMDQLAVNGAPRMNEIVFCHRPSRTLLLTDLCFNFRHSDSLVTRIFMRLNGAYGCFGPSRLAGLLVKDHAALEASVERILALDFDRVIVTHGEVLENGGEAALRSAFAKKS